jgi:O-antigen/teichoic acid export membrane protein
MRRITGVVGASSARDVRARTSRNAAAAAAQAAVGGLAIFITYRFLVTEIGTAGIGTWSLAVAACALSSLPGMGVQVAIQHFVASRVAAGDPEGAATVVFTSAIVVAVLVAIGVGVTVILAPLVLPRIVGATEAAPALSLMPWAVISVWLLSMCGAFQAALDGMQKATLRSGLYLAATAFYMVAAIVLTRLLGLPGLGWANVLEYALLLAGLASGTRVAFARSGVRTAAFRLATIRLMLRYSAGAQAMAVAAVLFDPIAKALLGRYSGLSQIGIFDMASRLVVQLRSVVVAASGVLISVFTEPGTPDERAAARRRYLEVLGLVSSASIALILGLEGMSPAIAIVWLGAPSGFFVEAVAVLGLGWGVNMLMTPAFMVQMGQGTLRWNVLGQFASVLTLAVFGISWALLVGASGVLWAYALALSVAGVFSVQFMHRAMHIGLSEWIGTVDRRLIAWALGACAGGWTAYGIALATAPAVAAYSMIAACAVPLTIGLARSRSRRTLTAALSSVGSVAIKSSRKESVGVDS